MTPVHVVAVPDQAGGLARGVNGCQIAQQKRHRTDDGKIQRGDDHRQGIHHINIRRQLDELIFLKQQRQYDS